MMEGRRMRRGMNDGGKKNEEGRRMMEGRRIRRGDE